MRQAMILAPLLLGGCISSGPIVADESDCFAYVPQNWALPVPGAPLPEGEEVGDWIAALDEQTGQLDTANARYGDTLHILRECERHSREAVKRSRPRFLGLF